MVGHAARDLNHFTRWRPDNQGIVSKPEAQLGPLGSVPAWTLYVGAAVLGLMLVSLLGVLVRRHVRT